MLLSGVSSRTSRRSREPLIVVECHSILLRPGYVSDGFVGDLRKLVDASQVGADVDLDRLPLSPALANAFDDDAARKFAATGGDDYELCFTATGTVPPELVGVPVTAVGTVVDGNEITCRSGGDIVAVDDSGYRHFQ